MTDLQIVILAAGQGTRMRSALPKVLHPLAGKPLLEHVVATAQELEPTAIHVVYGHGGDAVRERLSTLPVRWVEQAEQHGTGHAVDQAMSHIPDSATVLVLYGDVPLIGRITLRRVLDAVASAALALVSVELADPSGYGRILRDANGHVTGIVEHKDATDAQLAITEGNSGILAARAADLRRWLKGVSNDNASGEYYLTDVIEMAASTQPGVTAIKVDAQHEVLGVNDRVQLAHLERVYQRQRAEALMRGGVTLADPSRVDIRGSLQAESDVYIDVNVVFIGDVQLASRVHIGPNCVISDCTIGQDTRIEANCVLDQARIGAHGRIGPYARLRPGAELAEQVHIGNFVEVKNTRLGAGSKANHLTYLGDAEIGRDVNVGAGTITCNYDGANKHRTVVGDRVFIGSGVELVAPIVLNDDSTVGAGSTLSKDAPPGQLTLTRVRQTTIAGWRRPTKKPKS